MAVTLGISLMYGKPVGHKEHRTVCNAVYLPTQTLQCVWKTVQMPSV